MGDDLKKVGVLALGVLTGTSFTYLLSKWLQPNNKSITKPVQQQAAQAYESQVDLKNEQLVRIRQYFSDTKFQQIENSYIVVIGAGAIGSHVLNLLARSGVSKLRIIDGGVMNATSISRHAFADRHHLGMPKTEFIRIYIGTLLPHIKVQCFNTALTPENIADFIPENADYLLQCTQDVALKTALAQYSLARGRKLLISGSDAGKNDATKIQIRDFSQCLNDPTIYSLRKQLNKVNIQTGIKVVSSYQELKANSLRASSKIGTMAGLIGLSMASYALCQLGGEPQQCFCTEDIKTSAYLKLCSRLKSDQKKYADAGKQIENSIDFEDVYFLVRQVYEWRCLVTQRYQPKDGYLVRWDPQQGLRLDNIVFMGREAYQKHIQLTSKDLDTYPADVLARYNQKRSLIQSMKK